MKSNNLLTYLLYALLAALILAAGYKACQMQKEKQKKAQEQAEWEATIKKLYPEGDSTATGSSYVDRDSATTTTTTTKPVSPQTGSTTTAKPTTTKPSTTTTEPSKTSTTTKGGTTVKGVGSGKWEVRAGTFQDMERARDQLEKVIRMGYTNAEIKKASNGWAAVVVLRTNDKNKAIQVVDQLEKRGMDAAVFKR